MCSVSKLETFNQHIFCVDLTDWFFVYDDEYIVGIDAEGDYNGQDTGKQMDKLVLTRSKED